MVVSERGVSTCALNHLRMGHSWLRRVIFLPQPMTLQRTVQLQLTGQLAHNDHVLYSLDLRRLAYAGDSNAGGHFF